MAINIPRLFGRARDKPVDALHGSNSIDFFFGGSTSGKSVNPRSAMQLSAVYACVKVIAETVASLPLHVYRNVELGSEKAINEPLYRLLHDEPNSEMTSFMWRETMMTHLLLWGNSYSQKIYNYRGELVGLYPLSPEYMDVTRDKSGQLVYTYTTSDGKEHVMSRRDVFHVPGLGFDGVVGYSPIAMERNALGLALAAEEYGSKFFANGATPSGVLVHPNTIKNPEKVRAAWTKAFGGSGNAGKTAVLEEGMRYERISMPNNEAQFLESRKFQVAEICRIYRVPPHLIADLEHATYSNIEHQSISFGSYTIRPWLVRIEQAANMQLLTDSQKGKLWTGFNLDGLLRGDYKSRMEGYAIGRQNGWLNANDIRDLENMNQIPPELGGNDYLVNGNMVRLQDAGISYNNSSTGKTEDKGGEKA